MNGEDHSKRSVGSESDSEEVAAAQRTTRRTSGRAANLKRKREEESEQRAKEKEERRMQAELAKSARGQSADFRKLLKDIQGMKNKIKEVEDQIANIDEELRVAACQRTKLLGQDRFWNRYWWFERNGMPPANFADCSTSHLGYANGRLWVQGPDAIEREGFIDLSEDEQAIYKANFGWTIPERQVDEEGETHVVTAKQWGYYDDPGQLDMLIGWLDERGKREKNLRKELQTWRDQIAEYMNKAKASLAEFETERSTTTPPAGVSTRQMKTALDNVAPKYRCRRWKNTFAIQKYGHTHYDEPRKKPPRKAAAQGRAVAARLVATQAPVGRSGKPHTRQGTAYGR